MKIVNLSYKYFPHKDPATWISGFGFFYGIWKQLAKTNEIIFTEFIDYEGMVDQHGLKFWFLKRSPFQLFFPFSLHRLIRKTAPDVVVIHGLMFPLQVLLLKWQMPAKTKIIIQHHAEQAFQNPFKVAIQRIADRYVDAYFFTGKDQAATWIQARLIRDGNKVAEIMEASSAFTPMPKAEARAHAGIIEKNVYLWVGHLNANKNPLMVVRAFLKFAAQRETGAALYMIFQSNGLLEDIKTLLADNPEAAHIHLVGKVEHAALQSWFSAADYFISGSYYESSGIAVCEAMSCGCIPILTYIPSFRFMTGGRCGLLYETGEEDALVAALEQSSGMNKVEESRRTLLQFQNQLSFEAIAGQIQEAISGL